MKESPEEESKTKSDDVDPHQILFAKDAFDMLCDELPIEIIKMFEKFTGIKRDDSQNQQQK